MIFKKSKTMCSDSCIQHLALISNLIIQNFPIPILMPRLKRKCRRKSLVIPHLVLLREKGNKSLGILEIMIRLLNKKNSQRAFKCKKSHMISKMMIKHRTSVSKQFHLFIMYIFMSLDSSGKIKLNDFWGFVQSIGSNKMPNHPLKNFPQF